jgi:hypothetical protein
MPPTIPSATLVRPNPLPKAGEPSMAIPRAMRPIGTMTSPTMSNESNMPWIAWNARARVA